MTQSFYSQGILNFIDANSNYFNSITPAKFAFAGSIYADLAQVLNYSSDRWLRNWLNNSYGENKSCEVPHDWEDWLASRTQQSVSINFLSKYLPQTETKHDYPDERKGWHKELELEPIDLDLTQAISIANPEDIKLWSQEIETVMIDRGATTFARLQKLVNLKPVEILLCILLGEQFLIVKDDEMDFYGDFLIQPASQMTQ